MLPGNAQSDPSGQTARIEPERNPTNEHRRVGGHKQLKDVVSVGAPKVKRRLQLVPLTGRIVELTLLPGVLGQLKVGQLALHKKEGILINDTKSML